MKHTITVQEVIEKEIEVDLEVVNDTYNATKIRVGDNVAIVQDNRNTAKLGVVEDVLTHDEYQLFENDDVFVYHLFSSGQINKKTFKRIEADEFSFLRKRTIYSYKVGGKVYHSHDILLLLK